MNIWKKGDPKPANWPQWLKNANIEWCNVYISEGHVIWRNGVWDGGEWHGDEWCGGRWNRGTWHSGIWRRGEWTDGVWYDGSWHDGIWCGGRWFSGEWRKGEWYDGRWYSGVWNNGEWYGGEWHGGKWRGGEWYGGEWIDGEWYGGDWIGGDSIGRHVNQALVSWSASGQCDRILRVWDCPDRKTTMYSCGCFYGSREELIDFIYNDEGEEDYQQSRLRALAYVDELLEDSRTPMHSLLK